MNISELGKRCCGCGVCSALCPVHAITMQPDKEGFYVPSIDAQKCIDCGLCLKRCPVEQAEGIVNTTGSATYAAHAYSDDDLLSSSSGAVFTLLARDTLARGGRVYGAVVEDSGEAHITGTDVEAGIAAMRRSKYVQCNVDAGIYADIKNTLEACRPVLFTGCPCQIAAVKSYLNKEYDMLTTAEIVCHGVPSQLLFREYLKTLAHKSGAPVNAYTFRDKSKGWGMFFSYTVGGKRVSKRSLFDPFMNNFMNCRTYRESCYTCAFARRERAADITMGDFWGVLKEYPELYNANGLSAVMVNTENGARAFQRISTYMEAHEVEFERVARHNVNLIHPSARPAIRDTIYNGLGVEAPADFVRNNLKVHNSPGSIIKALLPVNVKDCYRKLLRR